MNVTVNGKKQEFADGATIETLAATLRLGASGVAVAVNNRVVPRSQWNEQLHDGDAVVIINASCGG